MSKTDVAVVNPFSAPAPAGAGSGALAASDEARSVAEVQSAMVIAKRFPRSPIECMDRILQACTRNSLAEVALYSYARGGSAITGPSIRLAETLAQCWGNIQFGFRELSRGVDAKGVGYADVEAFAWDLETNTNRRVSFRVRHWRDTKGGGYALKDERDIYELTANMAQRRVRACILGVVPGDVVEASVAQCEATLHAEADTSPDAMQKMLAKFADFGVSKKQIEARIQCRLEAIRPAQVIGLRNVYNSLRDGMSAPGDWFAAPAGAEPGAGAEPVSRADALKKKVAKSKAAKADDEGVPGGAPLDAGGDTLSE